jgi:hypothetical protein
MLYALAIQMAPCGTLRLGEATTPPPTITAYGTILTKTPFPPHQSRGSPPFSRGHSSHVRRTSLAFNINGFVGNVNRHLVRVLWSFGRLASTTTSEAGRRAAISASFDGFLNVSLSVSTEIPQGSSSSPILSVICSGPLDPSPSQAYGEGRHPSSSPFL